MTKSKLVSSHGTPVYSVCLRIDVVNQVVLKVPVTCHRCEGPVVHAIVRITLLATNLWGREMGSWGLEAQLAHETLSCTLQVEVA